MKKSKINRLVVISLQLAVLLLVVCASPSLSIFDGQAWGDQMPEEVVGAELDDGQEDNIALCYMIPGYVSMRYASNDSFAFFRFTTIPIAQGTTIDACTLFTYVITTSYDDPDIDIFCEDTASATILVDENNCISSRIQTTEFVEWIASDLGTGYKPSPELKTIVQEVINRDDWSEDNDLAFIVVVNPASAFAVDAYESSGDMAKLHIWYSTGEPPEIDKPRKDIMKGGIVR